MSRFTLLLAFTLALLSHLTLAAPPQPWYEKYNQRRVIVPQSYYEAISLRRQVPVDRTAVRDMVCLDTTTYAQMLPFFPSYLSSSLSLSLTHTLFVLRQLTPHIQPLHPLRRVRSLPSHLRLHRRQGHDPVRREPGRDGGHLGPRRLRPAGRRARQRRHHQCLQGGLGPLRRCCPRRLPPGQLPGRVCRRGD